MWPIFRKYRRATTNGLLILILMIVLLQLKSTSFSGLMSKKLNFEVQFYQIRNYAKIFDFLKAVNVTVIVLDPNMLTYGEVDEKFVTFGIFENNTYALKKALLKEKLPYGWTVQEHMQVDYRILNVIKVKSLVTAHFTFTSSDVGTLHLAIIFPRSNTYYWLSEFTDHNFKFINYSIPLPMGIEEFTCQFFNVSDYHSFCIPRERNHYLWQLQYAKFSECHYEDVVWKFEREFPLEKIDTRNHAMAIQEMMRIARKFEIPIMMAYGSLLGWYRQCDYIVHSKDIDTKMFAQDFTEELFRELWFSPILRMYVRLGTQGQGLEFRFFAAATVWFDLFLIYPEGDKYYTYMVHTTLQELHRSTYPSMKEICSADLLGVLVYIPCDPMRNILTEYGPDHWFTHKSWHYLNVEVVHTWNDSEIMYSNIHNYKNDCQNPTLAYGCDDPPKPLSKNKSEFVKLLEAGKISNKYNLYPYWNL